jgi:hypothetical protein
VARYVAPPSEIGIVGWVREISHRHHTSVEILCLNDRPGAMGPKMERYLNVVAHDFFPVVCGVDNYTYLHIQNPPPIYVAGCDEPDLREKTG